MELGKLNLQLHAAVTPVEFPLANIARVTIVTEEDTPVEYHLTDVATDADIVAYVNSGAQTVLRVKNVIKAQNNFEDIVLGYDTKLINATFIPEILALIDGGNWNEVTESYTAPVTGEVINRTPFTLKIYTEEKDADGSTLNYVEFIYANCKGKPVNYKAVDGAFFSPELNISSRSKVGESPITVNVISALPASEKAVVSRVAVSGVTIPVTGESPVSLVTEQAEYTGVVTWSPVDDPFETTEDYIATITLTAKSGYTFTGVSENFFTVSGATAVNAADSGVITATFPTTS